MKVGITADLHITTKKEHPERLHALENILKKCNELDIDQLIIAGDLFDQVLQDYSEFEKIINTGAYKDIQIHIIPGNHDGNLSGEKIVGKNVHIYNQPQWMEIDRNLAFLFIPYQKDKSMGEIIQEQHEEKELENDRWALVGHGDWYQRVRVTNPYEPGVYMPLTRRDLERFDPEFVFLGHIHDRRADGRVFYPGSPCGMDITETGYRHFLVFDTDSRKVEPIQIQSYVLYFHLDLVILPLENEEEYLRRQIQNQIESWNLDKSDVKKVQLRVVAKGYSTNREKIQKTIRKLLSDFSLYEEPNLEKLLVANDQDRNYFSQKLFETLENFEWKDDLDEPDQMMIVLDAMHLIYGE